MKLAMLTKASLISLLAISLAACSTTGKKDQAGPNTLPATDNSAGSVQTNAVNDNAYGFNSDSSLTTEQLLDIRTYYFKFDSTEILGINKQAVDAQGTHLSTTPTQYVLLVGNTDSQGSPEYNLGLGLRRAKAVGDELKAQGTQRKQYLLASAGAECPADPATTQDAYQKNRRVQLIYCDDASCQTAFVAAHCGKILKNGNQ